MKTSHVSYGFLAGFLTTVLMLQWWEVPQYPLFVWELLLLIGALLTFACAKKSRQRICIPLLACITGITLAFLNVAAHTHITKPADIESFASSKQQTVHGIITEAPDRRPSLTKYIINVDELTDPNGAIHTIEGRILVNDHGVWPHFLYGDHVTVQGVIGQPTIIDTFDYGAYLSLSDVYAVMNRGIVKATEEGRGGFFVIGWLYALRSNIEDQINHVWPEPQASLLSGLLLGSRRGIAENLTDAFRRAGISHVIAISGYNITVILAVLAGLLWWLPRRTRSIVLVVGITAFTLLVGASASVVRACIMGIIGLLALERGHTQTVRLSILWTACFMLLWRPQLMWYDVGFQMSFLAVIGLSELSPALTKIFTWIPETAGMRLAMVGTIAAQITTLPLTVFLFGQISLIAPIANILVAPLVPIAMLLGTIATMLSTVSPTLGLTVALLARIPLEGIINIALICGNFPFAAINI